MARKFHVSAKKPAVYIACAAAAVAAVALYSYVSRIVRERSVVAGVCRWDSAMPLSEAYVRLGGPEEALEMAVRYMRSGSYDEQEVAAAILRDLWPESRAAGLNVAGSSDVTERSRALAVEVLGHTRARGEEVVAILCRAMLSESNDVRREVASWLGTAGADSPAAVYCLERTLKDREPSIREYAVRSMGEMRVLPEQRATAVLRMTEEMPELVAETLGRIGVKDKAVVDVLHTLMAHKDANVRVAAALAHWRVCATPEDAISVLAQELSGDSKGGYRALRAVAEMGPDAASLLPEVESLCKSGSRGTAAIALARITGDTEAAVDMLLADMAKAGDSKRYIMEDLIDIEDPDPRVVAALMDALNDPELACLAVLGLGKMGPAAAAAVPALCSLVSDHRWWGFMVVRALGEIDVQEERVLDALYVGLVSRDDRTRWAAEHALGRFGAAALPTVLKAMRHDEGDVRRRAAHVAGAIGVADPETLAALMELQEDDDGVVRCAAAEALKKIRGEEAAK